MKNVKNLVLSLLIVLGSSCKAPYPMPQAEICVHYDDGGAGCTDLRLPEESRTYDNYKLENYICTNPKDYKVYYDYAASLREKLIKCESELSAK